MRASGAGIICAMAVMQIKVVVDENGDLPVLHTDLPAGTEVEVVVEFAEANSLQEELAWMKLAESSMDFWDNPVDDEVWNNA